MNIVPGGSSGLGGTCRPHRGLHTLYRASEQECSRRRHSILPVLAAVDRAAGTRPALHMLGFDYSQLDLHLEEPISHLSERTDIGQDIQLAAGITSIINNITMIIVTVLAIHRV
jgi:hypothetical protein